MVRIILLPCLSILAATLAIYSTADPSPRADFSYVNPSGIHTLDPARMSWMQDFRIALNIWEGLTISDPITTEPIEGAAKFPPIVSADGLSYTFEIRSDARWSNGDRVTAQDFVRGWRRGLEPGTATDYTFLFTDHIAGASDYVAFRQDGVTVLTALSRLRDGWTLDDSQGRRLLCSQLFRELQRNYPVLLATLPNCDSRTPWANSAAKLKKAQIDWVALYNEAFDYHVAAFNDAFSKVGITAQDDQTLVVKLLRPCPYFLDLAAFPIFLPCHKSIETLRERYRGSPITEQGLVAYDPQWTKPDYHKLGYPGLITNGPYHLTQWLFKRRARLTPNAYHRLADTLACKTIDMIVMENASAALMAYEAGDVDFLPGMDVPYDHEIARLSSSGERPDFQSCQLFATYFFNFNCSTKQIGGKPNPFVDPRVRKAFTLAIDRRSIVDNVLNRGDHAATTFVPPGSIVGYQSPTGLKYDPAKARRLLSEAGYPNGQRLPTIDLLYLPADERVVQALGRMWEKTLGATISLRCKESKTFAEDKANHRYMIGRANWYGDYFDPTTFLDCLVTGNGNNDSGYSSDRYDALIAKAHGEKNVARRLQLLAQAEALAIEQDAPILPILHYTSPIAIKPYVRGLHPNPRLRFSFRQVSITR